MPAKPCPSCKKPNCGNHAACARRKANECLGCKRSPCYDKAHCEASEGLWAVVATVESMVHHGLNANKDVAPKYGHLEPDTLSLMRWEVYGLMQKIQRERAREADVQMLGKLLMGGRRW